MSGCAVALFGSTLRDDDTIWLHASAGCKHIAPQRKNGMTDQHSYKKRFATCALAICLCAIGACTTIHNIRNPPPAFNLSDHAPYLQSGLALVKGTVRVGTGTTPQSCTGGRVYLMPDTPFFEAKVEGVTSGDSAEDLGLEDDRLDHVVRRSQCDLAGQFLFEGLPEAHWIILTAVTLPKGATGPALVARVATQAGLSLQVTLDEKNLVKK
jgi:hypothetical protein